ncbi:MAG: hypothetical protein AB8B80_10315 [Marinicellaceae bacterium]
MLLRRITLHVKSQNWFAVFIDFLIVVIGVFIGIQVANWNEEREDRKLENQYLNRLHIEIAQNIIENTENLELWQNRQKFLAETATYFISKKKVVELTDDHCEAIVRSHLYSGAIALPTTINELISTGQLSVITDKEIRKIITKYSDDMEQYLLLNIDIQGHRVTLTSKYPNLINRIPTGTMSGAICNFEEMSQSQGFLNDFSDNYARFGAYLNRTMKGQQSHRILLLKALDEKFGSLTNK